MHRNINPRTVLLAESGVAKLRGFSLSRLLESGPSETWFDLDVYAARYTSPEMARMVSDIDQRSDIYSLGCVLYHIVAGQPPFDAKTAASVRELHIKAPLTDPRRLRPDLPERFAWILMKCLEKERHKRYPTALALETALSALKAPKPPEPTKRGWLRRRRKG